jgi:hypothetical protein
LRRRRAALRSYHHGSERYDATTRRRDDATEGAAMSHVGVNLGFGNLHENLTDEQMYMGEVAIAELADRLGFDSLWAVEHHFDDYAMCPDNEGGD